MPKKTPVKCFASAEEFFAQGRAIARLADRGQKITKAAIRSGQLSGDLQMPGHRDAARKLSLRQRLKMFDPVLHGGEAMCAAKIKAE